MGLTHSTSSIRKISVVASMFSTSFLSFYFIFGLRWYGLYFTVFEFGFNLIFISPMAPFIPFNYENVFGNTSPYSRNNMWTSFIVYSS
jgi:hypothetical protein